MGTLEKKMSLVIGSSCGIDAAFIVGGRANA